MKKIYSITNKIINVLSKLEDEIKSKWEQKKNVKEEHYIITIDKLHKWLNEKEFNDVIDDVLNNKKQIEEWKRLGFGEIKTKDDIYLTQLSQDKKTKNKKKEQNSNLFEENDTTHQEQNAENNNPIKKLPIDTRHFNETFQENLLQKISEKIDIEEELNGLLIKSENWQALNNLLDKYREKIKCIYIDPPYNTGNDGFLYKDGYQHSTWLTMMENRLQLARELMSDDGVIFVSIDDNEQAHLKVLYDENFGRENFVQNFMWLHGKGKKDRWSRTLQQYILCYAKNKPKLPPWSILSYAQYEFSNPDNDPRGAWFSGSISFSEQRSRKDHPNYFEIKSPSGIIWKRQWHCTKEEMQQYLKEDKIFFGLPPKYDNVPRLKIFPGDIEELIPPNIIDDIESTRRAEKDLYTIFGDIKVYDFPKPIGLIKRLSQISSDKDSFILDFFAGSGTTAHAVMKLNAEDDGKRKFILVEMAEYFDTIIIPRIKKVAYSFDWKDGMPKNNNGIGCFIKYLYLQNFEEII